MGCSLLRSTTLAAVPSAARSPEEVAVESDRARHVREMVARLPERLGVPVGTVKSRLHHGLRRLAEELQENPV